MMKFSIALTTLIITIVTISCTSESTEYNGYVKNSTGGSITVKIAAENLLVDSIEINVNSTEKIYFESEDGDFEIYDCGSFFDTLYISGGSTQTITVENAEITSSSNQGSSGTRVHECTVEIK